VPHDFGDARLRLTRLNRSDMSAFDVIDELEDKPRPATSRS
jgi:hypothetical protein